MPLRLLALLAAPAMAAFSPSRYLTFDRAPYDLSTHCEQAKARGEMRLAEIASLPASARTFANTPAALDDALWTVRDETASDRFLKYVALSSSTRDAASDCDTLIRLFDADVYTRPDLYRGLADYAAKTRARPPAGEDARLLAKELLDFRRGGAALPDDKRIELRSVRKLIVELESDFTHSVDEDGSFVLMSSADLAGMPDDWVARLERQGPLYRVTTKYPDYFPFMSNAASAQARKRLDAAYLNRAVVANLPLLRRLLELRLKAAKLLGYRSHAEYVLADRMAGDPETVERFLDGLERRLAPIGGRERSELVRLKDQELGAESDHVIRAWDWRYYDNQRLKEAAVDEEEIKEYFPLETVATGMLSIYEKLLAVRFKRVADVAPGALWAPNVLLYEVDDADSGKTLAYFYLDLFPRDGKYGHSESEDLIDGRRLSDGDYEKPVAVIVANFPKPQPGRPSLLRHGVHGDVETLFHEFGHVLQMTLTKAEYGRFSGANVAQDFVEAPSQLFENWAWDPAVLARISGRYDDPSKKLPDALLRRMIAARDVDGALKNLQQLVLAEVDMTYHGPRPPKDTTAAWRRLRHAVLGIDLAPGTHPEAGFAHLEDGYDAGYYGYLWSQVYADDMFSRFRENGVLDPMTGRRYRSEILERGASRDEAESLRQFLGRPPSDAAFLERLNN